MSFDFSHMWCSCNDFKSSSTIFTKCLHSVYKPDRHPTNRYICISVHEHVHEHVSKVPKVGCRVFEVCQCIWQCFHFGSIRNVVCCLVTLVRFSCFRVLLRFAKAHLWLAKNICLFSGVLFSGLHCWALCDGLPQTLHVVMQTTWPELSQFYIKGIGHTKSKCVSTCFNISIPFLSVFKWKSSSCCRAGKSENISLCEGRTPLQKHIFRTAENYLFFLTTEHGSKHCFGMIFVSFCDNCEIRPFSIK